MKLEKGLYVDCSETDQPEGTYRFAKNIVDSNLLGAKENEDGFTNTGVSCPYTKIGFVPLDGNNVLVFSTQNQKLFPSGELISQQSEIGLADLTANTYTTIYNDPELQFFVDHPIIGRYRKDVTGGRVVAWVDGINSPRIINIDDLSGINDVEDLNSFQDVENPALENYVINDTGGALKTGALIPMTRYKNADGSETAWYVHDHTFYISDDNRSEAFNDNDGAAPGTISNKSISFTLDGCDTRYDTIVIGYIQIVNNITTAYQAFTRSNAVTLSVTISGTESATDVSLDEVLTSNTTYNTARTITELSGQLYLANLTAEPIPELQKTALGIEISYTHELMNVISNTNSHKDSEPPCFMPGEVYAFYLGVELNLGGWAFYHIPGRDLTAFERETVVDSNLGLTYLRYQVGVTADNGSFSSNMGAWENENENYPNHDMYDGTSVGNADLRNAKVRHHRFPTLAWLITQYYSGNADVGITHLPKLGIEVSNVIIPAAIQSKIKRWKIFFAKKTSLNSLVLGSDLYQAGVAPDYDPTMRWGTGGNWAITAIPGGSDNWGDFLTPVYDNIRCHSLDFLYDPNLATPTYAWFFYQLKRNNINTQYSGFRSPGATMTATGEDAGQVASAVIDFTVPTHTVRSGSAFTKRIDNFVYLPQNALNGKFRNQYNEPCFVGDIYNHMNQLDVLTKAGLNTRSSGADPEWEQFYRISGGTTTIGESTFYMQYYRLLSNTHVSFTQQDLVPVEGYGTPATTSGTFKGGDAFLCYMSYLATGPLMANPDQVDGAPYEHGTRMWKAYIGYSKHNFNYRYQTQGSLGSYYHGKTDPRTLFVPSVTVDMARNYSTLIRTDQALNVVNYDSSHNASNIFSVGVISSPDIVQATEFPNTIIWSPVQSEESKEFSWRSFPAGNRYTINRGKGAIINIQGVKGKELLIHTEHSIFRTRTDANVQAEGENIFFKSANLFDLPPEEMISTAAGYAGTQNKMACVLTKSGYAFVDNLNGKVFMYDGNLLDEISSNGMRVFFRDSNLIENEDNPLTGTGYTMGYDERNNRLLLTKRVDSTDWTISYNPIKKVWISYHDYNPDYYINTLGGNLYSVKVNTFYKHNTGPKGQFYDGMDIKPSFIDVPFVGDIKDKEFTAISWVSEIYPNVYTLGQPSTLLNYLSTCTHLTVRSPEHCTGRVPLVVFNDHDSFLDCNTRNLNRTWYFDGIRDISIDNSFLLDFYGNYGIDPTKLNTDTEWFDQRRFVDKLVTCRFEYDNLVNNRFLLLDVNAEYKYVQR